ncbi:MAG: hypothetical protein JWR89_5146 [Tardiphaga sp.]|uniref:hypothetical protein n=1 Tax=Tardiphaga sp. TaxID=1926292 RepID=UPI0026353ED5|nr:hypothetical protein [Tardiphaga sp.]MDB5505244.1 hypothetical protein [Tardiphaga sp.]
MSYQIGNVEVQGSEPTNVIALVFGRKTTDGGKPASGLTVACCSNRKVRATCPCVRLMWWIWPITGGVRDINFIIK